MARRTRIICSFKPQPSIPRIEPIVKDGMCQSLDRTRHSSMRLMHSQFYHYLERCSLVYDVDFSSPHHPPPSTLTGCINCKTFRVASGIVQSQMHSLSFEPGVLRCSAMAAGFVANPTGTNFMIHCWCPSGHHCAP